MYIYISNCFLCKLKSECPARHFLKETRYDQRGDVETRRLDVVLLMPDGKTGEARGRNESPVVSPRMSSSRNSNDICYKKGRSSSWSQSRFPQNVGCPRHETNRQVQWLVRPTILRLETCDNHRFLLVEMLHGSEKCRDERIIMSPFPSCSGKIYWSHACRKGTVTKSFEKLHIDWV